MPFDVQTFAWSVLTAGGGSAALTVAITKAFGSKWLDHKFSARLQDLKHAHQTEVEHLRFKIAALLDRASKLNQREFEVLPDIWAKVDEAHHRFLNLIARLKHTPDLTNYGDGQLEDFLDKSELSGWQKNELRAHGKFQRTTYYSDAMRGREFHHAAVATHDMQAAVSKSSIYIHPDTFERLNSFSGRLGDAIRAWQLDAQMRAEGHRVEVNPEEDVVQHYRETGNKEFEELGRFLRLRYWSASEIADPSAQ